MLFVLAVQQAKSKNDNLLFYGWSCSTLFLGQDSYQATNKNPRKLLLQIQTRHKQTVCNSIWNSPNDSYSCQDSLLFRCNHQKWRLWECFGGFYLLLQNILAQKIPPKNLEDMKDFWCTMMYHASCLVAAGIASSAQLSYTGYMLWMQHKFRYAHKSRWP